MPNREHDSAYFDRSQGRWWSRDQRELSTSSSRYGQPTQQRTLRGYSQADFDRAQSAYSPEWRSYAQDMRDGPQSSRELHSWPRAEGYARQRTDQGHRHESVYGDADSGRYTTPFAQHDEETLGQQLRHAGHQVVNKVKRAFRGPKGYKRSDERILEDVNERLARQDQLDPSEIEVRVENGEVTLSGSVESRWDKFAAEEIADDVSGVEDVHNQLRVRRAPDAHARTRILGSSDEQAASPLGNSNIRA